MVIEWENKPSATQPGWPSGWFAETEGKIDDPTFTRAFQGTHEARSGVV
jgi:hypothetical protein